MTKSAPKSVRALETNRSGDGIDREVLGRQAAPGLIQAAILHERAGRLIEDGLETPDEVARGKTGTIGQGNDRKIALRVGRDPAGELRQPIGRYRLKAEWLRVLILAARSFQIDDQIARHP